MVRRHRTPVRLTLALLLALAAGLGTTGCDRSQAPSQSAPAQQPAAAQPSTAPPSATASSSATAPAGNADAFAQPAQAGVDTGPVVLFLGDSITAGHGLPLEEAYPSLIAERLRKAHSPWRVVNAGVSGDTSAGGLSRLNWLLRQRVDVVVLALGGNDGLRGQDPAAMRDNLARIIERCRARGITVVLAGMQMPSNYGPDYTRRFKAVYPQLAEHYDLPFVPFLLDGVAMQPDLNQADGIHPNAQGARIVADNVWRVLKPVLDRIDAADAAKPAAAGTAQARK